MENFAEAPEFLFEPVEGAAVELAQRLEGDALLAFPVERLIDDAHAAGSDALHDGESLGAVKRPFGGCHGEGCHCPRFWRSRGRHQRTGSSA